MSSSILDNLGQMSENDWLAQRLEDNPEQDEALQTTARIATAHIWPFLASSISDDDYRNRRGVKEDQVRYICATIGPHIASVLVDHVLAGFDQDYAVMRHQAPGGGVHGPYKLEKEDGGYDVVNALGEPKGHHDTKGEAREQQKALYANIPEAREQAEEQHEGAYRQAGPYRRTAAAGELMPGSKSTLIPTIPDMGAKDDDDSEENGDDDTSTTTQAQGDDESSSRQKPPSDQPGLFEAPKADQNLEGGPGYYGWSGAGGMLMQMQNQQRQSAKRMDRRELARHLKDRHGLTGEDVKPGMLQLHRDHIALHEGGDADHGHMSYMRENQFEGPMVEREASLRQGSDVGYGDEAVPFEMLSPEERTAHIAQGHQMDPSAIAGMSALGSSALHQVLHDEAGLDVQHYHPRGDFMGSDPGIQIDRYGHIRLGAYDRSRDPQLEENDDPDPDQYWSEYNNRDPEADVYEDPEDSAGHGTGKAEFKGGVRQRNPKNKIPNTWKTSARAAEVPDLDDPGLEDQVSPIRRMSPEDLVEHMGEYHFGPGPRRPTAEAAVQETLGLPLARMQAVHDNAHDQGSRMHSPHAHGKGASEHGKPRPGKERPVREGQLARSRERPLEGHWRPAEVESGYDPSEAFPGYYGEAEAPHRPRTAQAPLSGQSDVPTMGGPGSAPTTPNVGAPPPQTPESSTGASGGFDPGNALNVAGPSGSVSGNMSASDAPQDIQSQLGQVPTLSHKVGAKLAEMATEALYHNPGLSAVAAIELSLRALRLYPKVATGGADYLAEPEPLERCPQCQRRAYNPEINRCHNCGFYDAGSEPAIEIT